MTWWVEPAGGGELVKLDSLVAEDMAKQLLASGRGVSACGNVRIPQTEPGLGESPKGLTAE